MSDEDAFLHAICDQPDEDTPRLAFADFLDDAGGPVNAAWAELIRVQMPLARGPGADRVRLMAREYELTPLVAGGWAERVGLPAELQYKDFVRGFPLTLSGAGAAIRAAHPLFAGRIPFREFNFRAATDADLVALAAWPDARLVRKLGVWTDSEHIGEPGLLALAGSEYLSCLQRLQMQWIRYTERGIRAFLDSPHLTSLATVKFVGLGFGALSERLRQRANTRYGEWNVY